MKRILLVFLLSAETFSGPLSIGVKAGIPLDRAGVSGGSQTVVDRPRWTVGPTIEARLWTRFVFGADALYRQLGTVTARDTGAARFYENAATDHWEVPIYLKYRFGEGPIRPFVFGGGAFEHASVTGTAGCEGAPTACGEIGAGTHQIHSASWGGGYLFGAGVDLVSGRVTFAPEFRYTRWVRGYLAGAGSDQPALLLGIRF